MYFLKKRYDLENCEDFYNWWLFLNNFFKLIDNEIRLFFNPIGIAKTLF